MNGMLVGMMVALLGGVGDAEPPGSHRTIAAQVRFLEMKGLGWRSALHGHLDVLAERGNTTVWCGPKDAVALLVQAADQVVAAPRLVCLENAEATVQVGDQVHFVSHLDRKADGPVMQASAVAFAPMVQACRDGFRVSLTGRLLDQGVLARLDLDESQLVGMHTVTVRDGVRGTKDNGNQPQAINAHYQVPEVLRSQVKGEWLIPKDGAIVLSLGARTVPAGEKPELRERVVVVEAVQLATAVPVATGLPAGPVVGSPRLFPGEVTRYEFVRPSLSVPQMKGQDQSVSMRVHPLEPLGGLMVLVPLGSPVPGLAMAGVAMLEKRSPHDRPAGWHAADVRVQRAGVLVLDAPAGGAPQMPSRHIPQGYAPHGAPVPLPPLPPESTREPEPSAEPMGTPQARAFPPAPASSAAEPVPVGVSDLPESTPAGAVSRMELTGNVTVHTRDGATIEADSLVLYPAPCPNCQNGGMDLDVTVDGCEPPMPPPPAPRTGYQVQAGGVQDVAVKPTSAAIEETVQSFAVPVPVLGGIVQLKVRVVHSSTPAAP